MYLWQIVKLLAAIKYEADDIAGCKVHVDQLPKDDPETLVR
jgi:tetratricopeptide repeat protein 30